MSALGKLERVGLREAWTSESGDFTPWLAAAENIALLGDAIDIELEVEAQEKSVGPFRADILCKDTTTNAWVLIENQLETTDHKHLGQLLTYAAGLEAVTIVWVAERFTDEHRATLDWLNEITDERFNFFGLEIELWRIGASPVAPKFNLISKPNDWSRQVVDGRKAIEAGEITETKQLQLDYWTTLHKLIAERKSFLRGHKPLPQYWSNFAVGRSNFALTAFANTRDGRIGCGLVLSGPSAKSHFHLLEKQRAQIESAMGEPLAWEELPEKKESHVFLRQQFDPTERAQWPQQHTWLIERLEGFHRAFSTRVKALATDGGGVADE